MLEASSYEARFKHTDKSGKPYWTTEQLVLWLLDGGQLHGYYLSIDGYLEAAGEKSNFAGYRENGDFASTAIPAAPGWWAVYLWENEAETAAVPVIGWRLDSTGGCTGAILEPSEDGGEVAEPSDK